MSRGHSTPLHSPRFAAGFSGIELLVCLALLAGLTTMAMPVWTHWRERHHAEAARDLLLMALQLARQQAIALGQALQLQSLAGCGWRSPQANDWSCGWQLIQPSDGTVWQQTAVAQPLSIHFTKNTALEISARGDLGQVGDRWTIQSTLPQVLVPQSVCLSNGGRLRWVAQASCG